MERIYAQITNPVIPAQIGKTGEGGTVVGGFVSSGIGMALIGAFLFALLYLLLGGIQWITSGGEKTQLETARNKITNAIIGLIIVASAYAVFMLVGKFIGIEPDKITIPQFGGK